MASEGQGDSKEQGQSDPRRLILPYVNTGMRIYKGRTTRELGIYAPGVIVVGLSALAFMSGAFGAGILVGIVAVPLILLGLALDIKMSRAWYHSPEGAIQEYLSYRRLKR